MTRPRRLVSAVTTLGLVKLVVNTAFRFVYPFLPAIGRGLGVDLTQAGMLVSVRWAAGLATPAVMTFSGQSHRSRRQLVAGLILFVTGSVVTAWTGVFVGAAIGFALLGLAKPLVDISSQVYVAERVGYEHRARYLGVLEVAWAGSILIGAPMAGWLIANWSWEAPFWVLGSLGLLAIGGSMLLLDRDDASVSTPAARAPDSPGRQVLLVLGAVGLFAFAHESVLVTLGGWLEGSFGLTLLALGGVGTLIGLSELVGEGAMVAFTDRIGKRNAMALGLGIAAVALAGLAILSESFVPSMIAFAVTTVALEFGYISAIPLMTELRPSARTRVLALSVVASALGRIAGDLIAPRVFASGGMRPVASMASAAALATVVVVMTGIHEVDAVTRLRQARRT